MGTVFGIVAFVIALVGVLAAAGHVGYLAMLNKSAKERGLSGSATSSYVSGRWKVAGGTLLIALVGLLFTTGGVAMDVIGILLAGGAGVAAKQALDSTRREFRGQLPR